MATATYGHAYEGPPGCVHGGMLAAAFDIVLGAAAATAQRPALTGTLTIRYRRPTPLHTEVRYEGEVDRVEERRTHVVARSIVDGRVTCEAEGVFVCVDPATARTRPGRQRVSGRTLAGPLAGLKVVELVGLGPGPFCGMLLADLGAEVLRVDRIEVARAVDRSRPATNAMHRSQARDRPRPQARRRRRRRSSVSPTHADAMFEVFRPGVVERLGIGPDVCLAPQPRASSTAG